MTSVAMAVCMLVAVIAVVVYVRLYRRYRRNVDKVKFLFDSIDNLDYSFNFPTDGKKGSDRLMNESLNRIKVILRRDRDEALEREKYYEQIINSVDTGIMVVNAKGNILQHNKAATRLLGVDVLTHLDRVRDRMDSRNLSKRETPAVLKGKKVSVITLSDINKELSDNESDSWIKLIRVLTHEIMNTITPITSLSETLLRNAKGEQKDGLEVIHRTGKELMAFVENYRKFTHVPAPRPGLFYVKAFLERMASLSECHVEITVTPPDLMVYADEGLVSRVVTNVLRNAAQATGQAGRVWIDAYVGDGEAVVIDISNDGELIPDDVAQHIFIPFFTTKREGSGIGLSLSRQIMRLSGGTITLLQDKARHTVTFRLKFV